MNLINPILNGLFIGIVGAFVYENLPFSKVFGVKKWQVPCKLYVSV